MTSHDFDAYLDMQPDEYFEPPYHEQLLVMQEIQESHENQMPTIRISHEQVPPAIIERYGTGNDFKLREEDFVAKSDNIH